MRCFPGQIVQVFNPSWIVQVVWRIKIRELDLSPLNPNQPTNQQLVEKCHTLVVTIETRVGLGGFGGVGFRHLGFVGAKFCAPLRPTKTKKNGGNEVVYFYGEKKSLQKNEETHIPPKSGKKFGKLSTQKCGG